jgi:hypothetical protein
MNDLLRHIPWQRHLLGIGFFVLSAVALMISTTYLSNQQQALEQAQLRYRAQQNTLSSAESGQQQLERYWPIHQAWQQQGLIGSVQRLNWVDSLKQLSNQLAIPQVHFTLESTKLAKDQDTAYWHNEIDFYITPMRVEMALAHEGDFMRLMQGLRNQAQGLFSIDMCDLKRETQNTSLGALRGNCLLNWYSLEDVTARWNQAEEATP